MVEKGEGSSCQDGKVVGADGNCVMPEVTFTALIMSFNTSVLYHLGEIADPVSGQKSVDRELARHTIDTLVLLEEKTVGNLDENEKKMLTEILYDVKMRYVKSAK